MSACTLADRMPLYRFIASGVGTTIEPERIPDADWCPSCGHYVRDDGSQHDDPPAIEIAHKPLTPSIGAMEELGDV